MHMATRDRFEADSVSREKPAPPPADPEDRSARICASSSSRRDRSHDSSSDSNGGDKRVYGYVFTIDGEVRNLESSSKTMSEEYLLILARKATGIKYFEIVELAYGWTLAVDEDGRLTNAPNFGMNLFLDEPPLEPRYYGNVVAWTAHANPPHDVLEIVPLPQTPTTDQLKKNPELGDAYDRTLDDRLFDLKRAYKKHLRQTAAQERKSGKK